MFKCSNYATGYVNWNIKAINRRYYAVSFSNLHNTAGDTQDEFLGSFVITASVVFTNHSSVVSSLTITNAWSLNGTNISCNDKRTTSFCRTAR